LFHFLGSVEADVMFMMSSEESALKQNNKSYLFQNFDSYKLVKNSGVTRPRVTPSRGRGWHPNEMKFVCG